MSFAIAQWQYCFVRCPAATISYAALRRWFSTPLCGDGFLRRSAAIIFYAALRRLSGRAELNVRMMIGTTAALIAIVIVLYDVQLNFMFSMPGEAEQPDAAQEALYDQCYQARDEQIHTTAFGTIDNPDVQKEFINTSRARAASACRNEYPRQWEVLQQPFVLNVFDLQPRYW